MFKITADKHTAKLWYYAEFGPKAAIEWWQSGGKDQPLHQIFWYNPDGFYSTKKEAQRVKERVIALSCQTKAALTRKVGWVPSFLEIEKA